MTVSQGSWLPPASGRRALATRRNGFDATAGRVALIVEDDYRSTLALTALLERSKLDVVSAPSGYAALDALTERDDIGIVVIDIMMPVFDGYSTIKAIRRRRGCAALPIIAVSAKYDDGNERERCLAAGASHFMPKPLEESQFLTTIAGCLPPAASATTG